MNIPKLKKNVLFFTVSNPIVLLKSLILMQILFLWFLADEPRISNLHMFYLSIIFFFVSNGISQMTLTNNDLIINFSFIAENLYLSKEFLVSMNLTLSYEAAGPVHSKTVVMDKVLLPKKSCDWSSDFHVTSELNKYIKKFFSVSMVKKQYIK